MNETIGFQGGRYTRLLFTALYTAIAGVVFILLGLLIANALPGVGVGMQLLGIVLVGIDIIGFLATMVMLRRIGATTLRLEPDGVVAIAGPKIIERLEYAQVECLCNDYERVLAGKEGLRLDPSTPTGIRISNRRQTLLIKGSMLKPDQLTRLKIVLAEKTGQRIEKPRLGPEVCRIILLSESYELKPESGLGLLTENFLLVCRDNKERTPAVRNGKTRLILPRNEISSVEKDGEKLRLTTSSGPVYELSFAYPADLARKRNEKLLERWFKALSQPDS
jgi:hypothetical protein